MKPRPCPLAHRDLPQEPRAAPAGLDVVAGGAKVSDQSGDFVIDTAPAGQTGWQASGIGSDGDTMIVSAICAPAAQTGP